jgi:hypothetical protein
MLAAPKQKTNIFSLDAGDESNDLRVRGTEEMDAEDSGRWSARFSKRLPSSGRLPLQATLIGGGVLLRVVSERARETQATAAVASNRDTPVLQVQMRVQG